MNLSFVTDDYEKCNKARIGLVHGLVHGFWMS